MRNRWMIVAAASMVLGATVPAWQAMGEDKPGAIQPNSNQGNATPATAGNRANSGAQNGSATEQRSIRELLATTVDNATTPGKFNDLATSFSRADQDRLNNKTPAPTGINIGGQDQKNANPNVDASTNAVQRANATGNKQVNADNAGRMLSSAELDAKLTQFQKDWKAKYNQDFQIRAQGQQVFSDSFARIDTTMMGDTARTASERIAPSNDTPGALGGKSDNANSNPNINTNAQQHGTDAGATGGAHGTGTNTGALGGQGGNANGNPNINTNAAQHAGDGGDTSRTDSRAVVTIPESHGAPAAMIPLVNQSGAWRIDLPDSIDNQMLAANLARHIDMVDQDKANWPADVNEAYRAVSHHVLLALTDSGMKMDRTNGQLPSGK